MRKTARWKETHHWSGFAYVDWLTAFLDPIHVEIARFQVFALGGKRKEGFSSKSEMAVHPLLVPNLLGVSYRYDILLREGD